MGSSSHLTKRENYAERAENYLARTGRFFSSGGYRIPLGKASGWRNEGNHRAIESKEDANEVGPSRMSFLIVSFHLPSNYSRIFAQDLGTHRTIYSESRFWARGQLLVRAQKALMQQC
jgi:hypothetical protein